MKRIKVYGSRSGAVFKMHSMKVLDDDKDVTDESRNTVYNVLRLMIPRTGIYFKASDGYFLTSDNEKIRING